MLTIAVDAMGGDHAPKREVEGAVRAARSLGVKVILVGQEDLVRRSCAQHDDYRELPIEVRSRQRARHHGGQRRPGGPHQARQLACGWPRGWCATAVAQGFVSAGNTGAVMATAKMVQGVVPGVDASRAGRRLPHHGQGLAGGGGGRGRQRGLLAAHAGAVRGDGRDLLAHHSAAGRGRAWDCSRSARKSTRATS